MIESLKAIRTYTAGMSFNDFSTNDLVQDAVVRRFLVVGEGASSLSEPFRTKHTGIPWGQISGMRNRMIHRYWQNDIAVIWKTVTDDVPVVLTFLERI